MEIYPIREYIMGLEADSVSAAAHIKQMIIQGADPNLNYSIYGTPLHAAAERGYVKILRKFIALGANVNAKYIIGGETPLHIAAHQGNINIVNYLINKNAYIECKNVEGDPPLLMAAFYGQVQTVARLIELGANYKASNHAGDTALHYAAGNNDKYLLNLLSVQADINIDIYNSEYQTPLITACKKNNVTVLKRLFYLNANVNHRDSMGSTVAHYAPEEGRMVILMISKRFNVDINIPNINYLTPMTMAVTKDNRHLVHSLIVSGASINFVGNWNPLFVAVRDSAVHCVRYFLDGNEFNIDENNLKGQYVLNFVTNPIILRMLLDKGADINSVADNNKIACNNIFINRQEHSECYRILNDHMYMLGLINEPIHAKNLQFFQEELVSNSRTTQLQRLNEITINNSETVIDFMRMGRNNLGRYGNNSILIDLYRESHNNFENKFHNFGYLLNQKYDIAVKRCAILKKFVDYLSRKSSPPLPYEGYVMIADNMTDEEMLDYIKLIDNL